MSDEVPAATGDTINDAKLLVLLERFIAAVEVAATAYARSVPATAK